MNQAENSRKAFDFLAALFPTGTTALDAQIPHPVDVSAPTISPDAGESPNAVDHASQSVAATAAAILPELESRTQTDAPGGHAVENSVSDRAGAAIADDVFVSPTSDANQLSVDDVYAADGDVDVTTSYLHDGQVVFAKGSGGIVSAGAAGLPLVTTNETFAEIPAPATTVMTPAAAGMSFSLLSLGPPSDTLFPAPPAVADAAAPGLVWMTGDLGTFSGAGTGTSGTTGGGSVTEGGSANSGLVININWDASVANAPVGFQAGVQSVVNYFESHFSNPISITIDVGYGEVNGQAMGGGALGESESYVTSVSYSALQSALVNNANAIGATAAAASLPTTSPVSGSYWLTTAEAQALGLAGSNAVNGYIGLSSAYSFCYNNSNGVPGGQFDFFGTVAHEITEVMGRSMFDGANFFGGPSYEPLDLFHYSAPGVRDFYGATAGYFSGNGGTTNLNNFNTNAGGDYGDWAGSAGNDSFLAFSAPGVVNGVSANDLTAMNLLGWDPTGSAGPPPVLTIALAHDTSGSHNITSNDALTGTADANAAVRISEGATVLGTATADGSGVWSFTPTGLAQGTQTVTASETDAAGLTGSASLTFTYDTVAPTVTIALAHDTSSGNNITSNDALTGTADANAAVRISEGATVLGTATANSSGVWSFTPTGLPQGTQTVTASETDGAGLTGSASLTFTYDSLTPILAIALAHDTGGTDNITYNDTLTGRADARARVTLSEGSTVLGTTTANGSGGWSFTPTGLAQGVHTITASETNSSGYSGTAALTFTYDTVAPTVISEALFDSAITGGAGTLTAGQTVQLAVALTEAIVITGGIPALMLNDSGTATYDAPHSTSTSLVFDYTVAAGPYTYTNALSVIGINLNGASVTDSAGNAANFAGVNTTFANLAVDATIPVATADHTQDLLNGTVSVPTANGVLANDSDANPIHVLTVSAVNGSAANVGQSISGTYGVLTMQADGGYAYSNTNADAVAALGGLTEDSFTYTVSNNGNGGTADSVLNVLITSSSQTYLTGASGSSIRAGNGSYVLDGSAGDMTLTAGNKGTQWLVGGAGDTLNGKSSTDTFLFPPNFGNETIKNFNAKYDVIDLPHSEFADFAAVQADLHAFHNNVVLTLDAADSITLAHLSINSLHSQNFHFF